MGKKSLLLFGLFFSCLINASFPKHIGPSEWPEREQAMADVERSISDPSSGFLANGIQAVHKGVAGAAKGVFSSVGSFVQAVKRRKRKGPGLVSDDVKRNRAHLVE